MKYKGRGVKITKFSSYLPSRTVSNMELSKKNKQHPEWAFDNLGIKSRHISAPNELASDMAAACIKNMFQNKSDTLLSSVDLLILATSSPDQQAPSTATITLSKLEANGIPSFDIAAVCSGFVVGLITGAQYIKSGMYDCVLVVGADCFSKSTDWNRKDSVFFGDGAGAVLLEASWDEASVFESSMLSDVTGVAHFEIPKNSSFFEMDGKQVFKSASSLVPSAIERVLKNAGLHPSDIDIVIPHQPSIKLLQSIAISAGIPFSKFHTNMESVANTVSGTVPIALCDATAKEKINSGDTVLFLSAGAGMIAAAAVMTWA
ncbi:ketoacyl-ACP synthase III [Pseudomonas sp. R3-56]|uniref:3-oxoacyl-ACP synthase III family protein n=1 Tax=Pseudomonas sp. R3-56 TaxID=2817401 RepID=UPI003DA940E4